MLRLEPNLISLISTLISQVLIIMFVLRQYQIVLLMVLLFVIYTINLIMNGHIC